MFLKILKRFIGLKYCNIRFEDDKSYDNTKTSGLKDIKEIYKSQDGKESVFADNKVICKFDNNKKTRFDYIKF